MPHLHKLPLRQTLAQQKWLTLIGLPILIWTTLNGYYALWGLLFVFWGVVSLRSGSAYLLEPIERRDHPVLFWILIAMWIGFGLLYVYADFVPTSHEA